MQIQKDIIHTDDAGRVIGITSANGYLDLSKTARAPGSSSSGERKTVCACGAGCGDRDTQNLIEFGGNSSPFINC